MPVEREIISSGLPGRRRPVRRSTTPFSQQSSHGSVSQASAVVAIGSMVDAMESPAVIAEFMAPAAWTSAVSRARSRSPASSARP